MIGTSNSYKIATNGLLVNIRQQAVRVEPCEFDAALIQNPVRQSRPTGHNARHTEKYEVTMKRRDFLRINLAAAAARP